MTDSERAIFKIPIGGYYSPALITMSNCSTLIQLHTPPEMGSLIVSSTVKKVKKGDPAERVV
jgi:hypothetical protein